MDERLLNELVLAAQQGDTAAFTEIVRRFEYMAQRIGMVMLGERHYAEDAAQEAFIDAYLSLAKLRDPAAFPGWFRRIMVKHCDRQIRRKRGEVPLEAYSLQDGTSTDMLDTLDMRLRTRAALATLSERQRILLQLFYIEGYSQREIVSMLGWPLPTIKKQLFLARHHLREEMNDMIKQPQQAAQIPSTTQRVEFFLALQAHDAARVEQLAHRAPALLSAFTEWAELDNSNYWPLGYTALHYAVGVGDTHLTDTLIAAGADVNALSQHNFATPLHVAVLQGRVDLVSQLLAAGANIGAVNCNGQSALHFAAYRNDEPMLQRLLAAGAAPSLKDAGGRTPLDWAIHRGSSSAILHLRNAGSTAGTQPSPLLNTPTPERSGTIFETGIKIIDLFAPLARNAVNAVFTPFTGVGKVVLLEQLIETMARQYHGHTIFLGVEAARYTGADLALELNEAGLHDAVSLFFGQASNEQSMAETVAAALTHIQDTSDTLLMVDTLFAEVADLQASIEAVAHKNVTVIWYGDYTAGVEPARFAHTRAVIGFELWRALHGYWPAIDPLRSHSSVMEESQAVLVAQAQRLLRRYEDLRILLERDPRGMDALPNDVDRVLAVRGRTLHAFLSQPFSIAELWTNTYGEYVPRELALAGLAAVLNGEFDDVDEAQLRTIAGTRLYIRR